ncbi:unnamed protein product, partial [Lampetra planeri]
SSLCWRLCRCWWCLFCTSCCEVLQGPQKKHVTLQDPLVKYPLKLIDKQEISHDTKRFRFGLPSDAHVLGLPVGQHVYLSARVNGSLVVRAYTPVSSDDDRGHVDLVVKVYYKNTHPSFPEEERCLSTWTTWRRETPLTSEDRVDFWCTRGMVGFPSELTRSPRPGVRSFKQVAMIAGGTGITPMLQLIRRIAADPNDNTVCSLIFANQTEKDILLREELQEVKNKHPNKVKLWFTLDKPPLGKDTFKVKISSLEKKEHIRIHVQAPLDRGDGSFLRVMRCPTEEPQIEADFKSFPSFHLQRLREEVPHRFANRGGIIHYAIINNQLFRHTLGKYTDFKMFSDEMLLSLMRKVTVVWRVDAASHRLVFVRATWRHLLADCRTTREAREIARVGQAAARELLQPSRLYCYYYKVLLTYSQRQRGQPTRQAHMEPVPQPGPTTPLCARVCQETLIADDYL